MEIPDITVVGRTAVCGTGHLQLAQLTCRRSDGRTHVWDAVERTRGVRDVVVVFPVTLARTVVLIEQFRPPVETRTLELPAGLCDIPGELFDDAGLRELEEETGYVGSIVQTLPPSAESSGSLASRLHLLLIGVTERRVPQRDAAEEFMAPRIIELPLDNLPTALLEYHAQYPKNLIDPKILTGRDWWKYFEEGGGQ